MTAGGYALDDVDKSILNAIQENARYTATELADRVGVSDNTIHNRLERLEIEGIITGYSASIDPDKIGLMLHILFYCSAETGERQALAQQALTIPEVIEVTELMTGEENLLVKAVCAIDEDIMRIAQELEAKGLVRHDETIIRATHSKSLDILAVEDSVFID